MVDKAIAQLRGLNALDVDLIDLIEHFDLVCLLSIGAVASTAVEPVFCPLITAEIELINLTIELILKGVQAKAAIEDISPIAAGQDVPPVAGSQNVIASTAIEEVSAAVTGQIIITIPSIEKVGAKVVSGVAL